MLTRMSVRLVAAVCALALVAGVAPAAPVTIDNFNTPGAPAVFSPFTPAGNLGAPTTGAGILGTRQLSITNALSALGDGVAIGGGILNAVSSDTTAYATVLNYNFGGTLDASPSAGITLDMRSIDGGFTTSTAVEATLFTTTGNRTLTGFNINDILPVGEPGTPVVLPFASFTGPGSVGSITGLQVRFNSAPTRAGVDLTLSQIWVTEGTFVRDNPVPEPTTLAVFGLLGVGGIVAARRKVRAA